MDFTRVDIIGLSTSPSSGGAYALVLGEVEGNRRLPIIIGAFEAQAIALELEKIQPPRPMTHDLLRDTFEAVEVDVEEVVIDELREGTFFAKIRYRHDGEEHQLDSRPSDAVALAVRVDAPIFVAPAVLDEAGIVAEDESDISSLAEQAEETSPSEEEEGTELEQMQKQLEEAVEAEDYERAAELRDEIQRLEQEQQQNQN
ncbi:MULTISPECIES: bifunctional nuclease family protein [Salinibacter]|jgi:bifunctional DNase/RNase|uniref:bifunctional nuclease family protein n=1 Tax=Salinibacter TaxID=146918 RepID=UPI001ABB5547|nr:MULTISPECIES: bifunctional nuclease family protein [Salinibacter]